MHERMTRPVGYWKHLERVVASKVGAAMQVDDKAREPVIGYLRNLEEMARAEGGRGSTIQVIASGRRVLGDRNNLEPADGPFGATFGPAS